MSKSSDQYDRNQALAAYALHRQGWTYKAIAERLGLDLCRVAARVKLGERLAQIDRQKS
jgi:hypothetical protein